MSILLQPGSRAITCKWSLYNAMQTTTSKFWPGRSQHSILKPTSPNSRELSTVRMQMSLRALWQGSARIVVALRCGESRPRWPRVQARESTAGPPRKLPSTFWLHGLPQAASPTCEPVHWDPKLR